MPEVERKYEIGPLFALPDLRMAASEIGTVVEQAPATFRTTYHDTADLRLVRSGISLRHRRGDSGPAWTVELQVGAERTSQTATGRGLAGRPPEELTRLVQAYTRGSSLSAVVTLTTARRRWHVVGVTGTPLAELVEDTVSVVEGRRVISRFRQLEVVRMTADADVVDRVDKALVAAGASADAEPRTQVRALGALAAEPPDLPPAQPLGVDPSAADVIIEELRRETGRLLAHDPAVRLSCEDPEGLREMRVACRRLRTDLRAFSPLFAATSTPGRAPVGSELLHPLRDFAAALRAVITPRRLRHRLGQAGDELYPLEPGSVERLKEALEVTASEAGEQLAGMMASSAYNRLLDGLVATARAPRLHEPAYASGAEIIPALAATFWERLVHGIDKLSFSSGSEEWRVTRRAARRLRQLSILAVPAVGDAAQRLTTALDPVINVFEVEREAHRSTQLWLAMSDMAAMDRAMAVTVGRLVEREQAAAAVARRSLRSTWDEQPWRTATEWLV